MKKLIVVLLLCSSCASTYKINGQTYKVRNQTKPNKNGYGIAFTLFIGLGESYSNHSR